jgi:SnoaL-like domain
MSDLRERYLACWNETDADTRRALLAEHWIGDATYVDPLVDVRGRDAVDAVIAGAQQQFPGFVFTAAADVDTHHDVTRFGWGLGPAGAVPIILGFDVVTTAADGRIERVVGFLDRVPA